MSLNVNKSNESAGGHSISDSSGQFTGFYTSGTASPVGNACPVPTLYLREDAGVYELWRNTGPLGTDWIQLTLGDPFAKALFFDDCSPMFDKQADGTIDLLEEC